VVSVTRTKERPADGPPPTAERLRAERQHNELEIKAAGRRAFYRSLTVACPSGHAPVGVSCWVVPNPSQPGTGLGVGFGPEQDHPVVCPRRADYAASLAST
jgi:hypothetical protein